MTIIICTIVLLIAYGSGVFAGIGIGLTQLFTGEQRSKAETKAFLLVLFSLAFFVLGLVGLVHG